MFWRQKESQNLEQHAIHEKREENAQLQAAGTEYRNRREFMRLIAYQAGRITCMLNSLVTSGFNPEVLCLRVLHGTIAIFIFNAISVSKRAFYYDLFLFRII